VTVATQESEVAAGAQTVTLLAKPRRLGRYRVRVRASSGAESVLRTVAFRVVNTL
jgi:hypothetical protein